MRLAARRIVGWRLDEQGDWVAELECGHGQHMRHRPPFTLRPWVVTAEGRASRLGTALECAPCRERLARAARSIGSQFREFSEQPVELLGAGTDHEAFLVGGRAVFRFPKRDDTAEKLARELALLPELAPQLPLAVPHYRWIGRPDASTPRLFAGYERLLGQPGLGGEPDESASTAIGEAIGGFARALHRAGTELRVGASLPPELELELEPWRAAALADLARVRGELAPELARWCEGFIASLPARWSGLPRLVHGDLAAEHVLLDASLRPLGVIDWSDLARGDPARDLAGAVHWGGRVMLRAALAAYGESDPALLERAAWFAAGRAVGDLAFGQLQRSSLHSAAGVRALQLVRGALAPQ